MIARLTVLAIIGVALLAQNHELPEFDAASVRRSHSESASGSTTMNKGSFVTQNAPLSSVIRSAYGLEPDSVVGPSWLNDDRYDINARTSSTDPDQMNKMLQRLLADRFGLRVHAGSKVVSGFDLVADKGGIKLQNVGSQPAAEPVADFGPGNALRIVSTRGMTMQTLARQLRAKLGAPVNDKTGSSDYYAGFLEFSPLDTSPDHQPRADVANRPSLFQALEQKGLRLQAAKVALPTVIVDSIQRVPTEN